MFILSFLVYLVPSAISQHLPNGVSTTQAGVASAEAALERLIRNSFLNIKGANELPMIAGLVRLAFHDCVSSGGCDGCIDHGIAHNAGLRRYTNLVDSEYDANFQTVMSRADFYALGSIKALETSTTETVDKFTGRSVFALGRSDCSSSPTENVANDFPISTHNLTDTLKYFNAHFGYSANQVVALLGAHTLGRVHFENSGYEGRWVDGNGSTNLGPASTLKNEYYINLKNRPWIHVEITRSSDNKKLKQW